MADRAGTELELKGFTSIDGLIDAVASGEADIGFLAPFPSREGQVLVAANGTVMEPAPASAL